MGILNGDGAALLTRIFAPIYTPGMVYQAIHITDNGGSIRQSFKASPARVQRDVCTEAMRQSSGYTERDARIIILNTGLTFVPDTDCEVDCYGQRWKLADASPDTCGSHYECRATPIGVVVDGLMIITDNSGTIMVGQDHPYMLAES